MTDASKTSPCFLFHHQYDGDNPNYDTSRFSVHCTLEKGAEAYYSGVRVVVIAKKIGYDDNFAKVEIRTRRLGGKRMFTKRHVHMELLEGTNEVIDSLSVDDLPLYTLILELVDLSNATWSGAELRLQAAVETSSPEPFQQMPDTHRVLYEYAKRTTVHSPSCVLILTTRNAGVCCHLNQGSAFGYDSECAYPERIGLPTHGFRILPPSERRPLFNQPPPEILHRIFSNLARDGDYSEDWRKTLIDMSLVCRAWWKVALCVIYEDFGSPLSEKLDIGRLATTLEDNPMWGRYIKRFLPFCFTRVDTETQYQRDVLTIFKTASNMREVSVGDVGALLAGEFVEAFCKMTGLRTFTQSSVGFAGMDGKYFEEKTYLNAAQLTKCLAHWPKLREVTVCTFGRPFAEDGNEFTPAQCALDKITFQNGFLSIAQLRAITASSRGTLHVLELSYIRGITNRELTSWLKDFGPNLTSLTLESNNVFTRSEADELALDATIHMMPKLSYLSITGPVATVLTLLKFKPSQELEGRIHITRAVLFDLHAFVKALYTTKWETVYAGGFTMLGGGLAGLIEEAERVAEGRGINLMM